MNYVKYNAGDHKRNLHLFVVSNQWVFFVHFPIVIILCHFAKNGKITILLTQLYKVYTVKTVKVLILENFSHIQ